MIASSQYGEFKYMSNADTPPPRAISLSSLGRFLLVGGLATGLHYLITALLHGVAGWPMVTASGTGFVLSAIGNYALNARFTFRSARSHRSAFPRFAATASAGLLINTLLLSGLLALGLHAVLAQLLTTLGTLIWNYVVNALWTFTHPTT
jgi:putative flippase GtrA